jgi:hypothetical protein
VDGGVALVQKDEKAIARDPVAPELRKADLGEPGSARVEECDVAGGEVRPLRFPASVRLSPEQRGEELLAISQAPRTDRLFRGRSALRRGHRHPIGNNPETKIRANGMTCGWRGPSRRCVSWRTRGHETTPPWNSVKEPE